jgi:hypothetical protein
MAKREVIQNLTNGIAYSDFSPSSRPVFSFSANKTKIQVKSRLPKADQVRASAAVSGT